ncbi:retrotransposon protein [Cucumis melo var. makuwa]|uniref:Retrotransposon protein n=1 Tax=Cucumis melo var. makuwa TaxID=1194695 RepID=A0A5A7T359_CUCMM|nr:retrotransposon protein [Cucumis melo var. makuwa]TYK18989.1 retrotransposon protein [Cucumis melo var. makuwa]
MANYEDFDDIDKGNSAYATTTVVEDIQYIETVSNECMTTSSCAPKHVWTKEEEDTLVECLVELVSTGGWKSDNCMFWPGYLAQLKCEGQHSGFDWNDSAKCIIVEKEVFNNWVRLHLVAKGLFNKLFSYYDEMAYVFRRNRATGRFAEAFTNVGSNEPTGYEGV